MAAGGGTSAAGTRAVRPDTLLGLGFVTLWGTGFVAAKYGLPWAGPYDFLALRFAVVAVLMLVLALLLRAPWPRSPREVGHIAVAGVLLHGLYPGNLTVCMEKASSWCIK